MVRQNLLTSLETCYEEGSEGLGGGRKQTAVATEWPCLLSPNNAPSSRPRGVLGRAGYPCLGNPLDRGAWQAIVHRVPKESDTI